MSTPPRPPPGRRGPWTLWPSTRGQRRAPPGHSLPVGAGEGSMETGDTPKAGRQRTGSVLPPLPRRPDDRGRCCPAPDRGLCIGLMPMKAPLRWHSRVLPRAGRGNSGVRLRSWPSGAVPSESGSSGRTSERGTRRASTHFRTSSTEASSRSTCACAPSRNWGGMGEARAGHLNRIVCSPGRWGGVRTRGPGGPSPG